jgi:hypothetical protein
MKSRKVICAAALILFAVPTASASTTWYVNGVSGSDSNNCTSPTTPCKTIGRAISLATSGDTVKVAATTYTENLTINIIVKVIGSGASSTIIDGGGVGTVVTISNTTAHVTLSSLAIRNGQATSVSVRQRPSGGGGGINNSGTLTLTNSTVSGNLVLAPCIHSFVFCEIRAGTASGGGIYNSGALIISNSIISGNEAVSSCPAESRLTGCSAFGGGIYNQGTLMTINNTNITGN